jgi:NTE family protein
MGNPPIFPLIDDTETEDILLIQINPIKIPDIPKTATEIRDRLNAISFNSSLMHEMRRIRFVQRILELGLNNQTKLRDLYIHCIYPENEMNDLGVATKLNTDWDFLLRLRRLGRRKAEEWLAKNYEKLGHENTCDIEGLFL